MLNPFKKKNNEFKLDDYDVKSMSENNNYDSSSSNMDNSSQNFSPTSEENQLNSQNSFASTMPNSNPENQTMGGQASSFPSVSSSSFSGPIETPRTSQSFSGGFDSNPSSMGMNNSSNDLINAKLEGIENKMALTDAKIANIEHKLNIIYNILMAEVSDQTKQKFSVNSMMDSVRNKQQ